MPYLPFHSKQDVTNELGTLQHNTVSVNLGDSVAIEPRPTFGDAETPASGDYGRGAFIHKGLSLFVTEDQIANSSTTTAITEADLNPFASACFSIVDDGTDKITVVQNAGYADAEGSIWYASDGVTYLIDDYIASGNTIDPSNTGNPSDVRFSADGTKMYVLGSDADEIDQYSLSPAWDITSASYDSKNLDVSSEETSPTTFYIGSDGTKVYVIGATNSTIYQYTMSTAWDMSTASYDTKSYDPTTQQANPWCLFMNESGSKMYVGGLSNVVYQYTLSTPFDVSTASYASLSYNAGAQTKFIWMNTAISKLITKDASHVMATHTLSTPEDISSASSDSETETIINTNGFIFRESTGDLYICNTTTTVAEYTPTDVFSEVTDVDAPGHDSGIIMARGCPQLNGYLFTLAAETGNIYNSDLNSVTAWTATNFIKAEREADYGCFLGKQRDHIVYIGTRSIEFFYDAANPSGSPLSRRQDIYHNVGCVFPNSCIQLGDDIYFIGANTEGDLDLYGLSNFQLTPFGNEYIKTKLRALDVDAHKNPYRNESLNFQQILAAITTPRHGLILILTINSTTYAIQPKTGHIAEWYPGADPAALTGLFTASWSTNNLFPIVGAYTFTPQNTTDFIMFSNGYTTSVEYDGDLDDFAGTSTAASSYFYLPKWNGDSLNKKTVDRYVLDHFPNLDSSVTGSNITLEWVDLDNSRDFGATLADADFDNSRTVSTNYSSPRVFRCGTCRERVHKVTLTPQKSQLLRGMTIDYTEHPN